MPSLLLLPLRKILVAASTIFFSRIHSYIAASIDALLAHAGDVISINENVIKIPAERVVACADTRPLRFTRGVWLARLVLQLYAGA